MKLHCLIGKMHCINVAFSHVDMMFQIVRVLTVRLTHQLIYFVYPNLLQQREWEWG